MLMPNICVQEWYCTLLLSSADLVKKWNCWDLKPACAVKLVVTKGSFCDLTTSFPTRTERDVRKVSWPFLWASCKVLQCVLGLSRSVNHICGAEVCLYDEAAATDERGWNAFAEPVLASRGPIAAPVSYRLLQQH